jgi:hypothetical protein
MDKSRVSPDTLPKAPSKASVLLVEMVSHAQGEQENWFGVKGQSIYPELKTDTDKEAYLCIIQTCGNVFGTLKMYNSEQFLSCICNGVKESCKWFPDSALCATRNANFDKSAFCDPQTPPLALPGLNDWETATTLARDTSYTATTCVPY